MKLDTASPSVAGQTQNESSPLEPAQLQGTLETIVRDSLRPIAAGLSFLYLITGAAYVWVASPPFPLRLTGTTTVMGLIFLSIFVVLSRRLIPVTWAHSMAAAMAILVLATCLYHLVVIPEPRQTTNLIMFVISVGLLLFSRRWLVFLLLATWLGWWMVTRDIAPSQAWTHFGFALLFASIIAVILQESRLRAYGHMEALRQERERKSDALEKALQATQRSEGRYRHLVEHSLGLICTHALDGRILSINPAAARALDYPAEEGIGRNLREFLTSEVQPLFDAYLAHIQRHGVHSGIMRVLTRSGQERVWDYSNVVYREDGQPPYVLGHAQDVTERAQIEGELRAARAELEQRVEQRTTELRKAKDEAETANRAKSEFLATISHELRTPLTAILGYAELLREEGFGSLTSQQVDILERVMSKAREQRDLIATILDLTAIETGRLSVRFCQFEIATLLTEIENELRELREQSLLTWTWSSEPDLPVIMSDPAKLKTVIGNVIRNAVKFTRRGSITIAAQRFSGGVAISITDTGIGITQSAVREIFLPFRQIDSSDQRQYEGIGLGLHIVAQLLELLHGTIAVESEVGRGSTFRIWIPTTPVLTNEDMATASRPQHQTEERNE